MKVAIGTKKGMTRVFKDGKSVPVTVIDLGACVVAMKDGSGVELGFGKTKGNKALQGKYRKLGYVPMYRRYFTGEYEGEVGDSVNMESFAIGTPVMVSGVSKGKGFAGVVKRWGFAGGPKTHGQSDRERAPGSIGAGTTPGRVFKGKKMGGRMGGKRVTLKDREIVDVIDNYVMVSGPVPGNRGDLIEIKVEA
jgi:large subunit ribosomal protein L3